MTDHAIGPRLRRLRTEAGLTQKDLAKPAYTPAYVSTVESGRHQPSQTALEHFAEKLGVSAAEIETGLPPDLGPRLELELQEARRETAAGLMEAAEKRLQRVKRDGQRAGLIRTLAKAEQGLALCAEIRGDVDEALEGYLAAQEILKEEPVAERVDAIAGEARCLQIQGHTRAAVFLLEQTLEALEQKGQSDPGAIMRVHTSLVAAYFERGAYERAKDSAEEAFRLARRSSDPERLGSMYVNVARVFLSEGKSEAAHDALRNAESLFAELDLQGDLADCHHARGYILARQSSHQEARAELERALEIYTQVGSRINRARVLIELGRLERLEEQPQATQTVHQALDLLSESDVNELAVAHRELALCLLGDKDDRARQELQRAASLFERSGSQVEYATTCRTLGDLLREQGDLEAAMDAFRRGILAVEEKI